MATHVDVNKISVDSSDFPNQLKQYYARLFPYAKYFAWLSYGGVDRDYFQNREFSFTLKDDVYVRYKSFADRAEMEKAIKDMCPYKIDIGAVFSAKPKDHLKIKASEFRPVEKELVFDIDMTDYDEIRTCCSGAAICLKCWPFMTVAIKIVDRALRVDFGFSHLLWVYSGRRGVHCWVCDKRARLLGNDGRAAIAEFDTLSGDQLRQVSLFRPAHPSIDAALEIATHYFETFILGPDMQNLMGTDDGCEKVLAIVGHDEVVANAKQLWATNKSGNNGLEKWKLVCTALEKNAKKDPSLLTRANEVILQYTYPRLDVNVSKQLNHLLKSPFVVHPKTGRVCVPLDVARIDDFDPFAVPTISELLQFV